jgi:predicted O-methyltransferase YrrM
MQPDADLLAAEAKLEHLVATALSLPGWRWADDLRRLGRETLALRDPATLVEVGCFFGRSTLVLAGALQIRGSGSLHCIDPFDASGDAFSTPHYARLLAAQGGGSMRDHVTATLERHGLLHRVHLHTARAIEVDRDAFGALDLLLLDGDQSRVGAQAAYAHWAPKLRPGGLLVVGNSAVRAYEADHDGHAMLVETCLVRDGFTKIERGDTTFAKAG